MSITATVCAYSARLGRRFGSSAADKSTITCSMTNSVPLSTVQQSRRLFFHKNVSVLQQSPQQQQQQQRPFSVLNTATNMNHRHSNNNQNIRSFSVTSTLLLPSHHNHNHNRIVCPQSHQSQQSNRRSFYTFVQQYQKAPTLTFGKLTSVKEPGFRLYFPIFQSMFKVDMRTRVNELLPQMIITADNVSCSVSAVLYYKIADAEKAVLRVSDVDHGIQQLSQTELRDLLCMKNFNDILENRDTYSKEITAKVEKRCSDWGVVVEAVSLKNIDLTNENMVRALAKEAESTRERTAAVIRADGEYRSAVKLAKAAAVLQTDSVAIQLRRLQTLERIAKEKSDTTLVVPMDVFGKGGRGSGGGSDPYGDGEVEYIDLDALDAEIEAGVMDTGRNMEEFGSGRRKVGGAEDEELEEESETEIK